jgi:hypothetical protein
MTMHPCEFLCGQDAELVELTGVGLEQPRTMDDVREAWGLPAAGTDVPIHQTSAAL